MSQTEIPGYTYGTDAVPRSPVSLQDLELLQATLLIDLANRHNDKPITGFDFRGQSPAFDGTTLHVCGEPTAAGASVWTEQSGQKNMVATVYCGS